MPMYKVTVTRTRTDTTTYDVEASNPEEAGERAKACMETIINGDDPSQTADNFEWEMVDETVDVEDDSDIEEL